MEMKHNYWNLAQILNHPTNSVEFKVKEAKKWLSNSKKELHPLKLRIMQKQTQYSQAEVVRIIESIEGLKELNFEILGENKRMSDPVESGGTP